MALRHALLGSDDERRRDAPLLVRWSILLVSGVESAGGTPLLYLAGERDEKNRALAAQAAEAGATVCIIPGAGHNAHLEAPATFAKEVASFLRK